MTLPQTYLATLCLLALSILCWGSWANTLKAAGKWRFELFYFDYSLGVMLAAGICALTFGRLGFDGFLLEDDLLQTGKRNIFFGALGGIVFNLGNMLFAAAISVAGLTAAFPISLGLALITGSIWSYALNPQGNPLFLFGGTLLVLGAVVFNSIAYRKHARAKLEEQAKAGLLKTSAPRAPIKGVVLGILGGVLMGSSLPLVDYGRTWASGLGPYAIGFCFAAGMLISTFPFNLFFMNLPVQGDAVEIRDYFLSATPQRHLLGILGGAIWGIGMMAGFVAAGAQDEARIGSLLSHAIGQGAAIVGALCGILFWKELEGSGMRVKTLIALTFALFLFGLALITISQIYL